ncbi:uncharacterized protein LOC130942134 [Arachis stenosperma]|uniref:uncharacterized protein LOC130942134 n=1 Tax=Arachis stenosperma TaxID=217475 RepID=UPI0025AC9A6B|nr:uncharacterized protein LOC130942134 [Arachis stenosperma]
MASTLVAVINGDITPNTDVEEFDELNNTTLHNSVLKSLKLCNMVNAYYHDEKIKPSYQQTFRNGQSWMPRGFLTVVAVITLLDGSFHGCNLRMNLRSTYLVC